MKWIGTEPSLVGLGTELQRPRFESSSTRIWVLISYHYSSLNLLSCMHQPVQPKSLSWWGEVNNSLIFQHSLSRGGSHRLQTRNRSKQQLFYLIALTRIRTRDLWLRYHIELHAPTNSTQKLKLMGRGGQLTNIPTIDTITSTTCTSRSYSLSPAQMAQWFYLCSA